MNLLPSNFAPITLAAVALAPLALVCAAPAHGQVARADLAAIDSAVAGFAGAGIGLPGGALLPVDRRLRLVACDQALDLSWRDARRDTVLVQCPAPGGWHIFVPVRAAGGGPVAVARGEAVTISVTGDGFSVSQSGEAVDGGALGDWIRVRAVKDGSLRSDSMRARIVRPGEVEVPLP
jgi:flagella basal body P-ring formation protein FlgA